MSTRSIISTQAPLELEVRIIDDDGIFSADDLVDVINIDFPRTLNLSATYSNTTTYQGACRNSDKTLDLQYRITSNCPENQYGPNCLTNCIPQVGQYYCNYLGGRVCHDNYYTSDCSVFCVPTSEQICNEDGMLVDRGIVSLSLKPVKPYTHAVYTYTVCITHDYYYQYIITV